MKKILTRVRTDIHVLQARAIDAVGNTRADFYISDGVKVIIAVVLGALLLAALTLLFNDTIIPRITKEITDLFG